jgi:hypothetical protein
MSDSERPEGLAFRELEQLVRHLVMSSPVFAPRARRRGEGRELESIESQPESAAAQRGSLNQLEHDNAVLRGRLEAATARTKAMLDRVRFIRQQAQGAER